MKKTAFFATILVLLGVAVTVIWLRKNQQSVNMEQPIVATFYPLAHFTERIASSTAPVVSLIPAGVEPHEYEPTPHDVARVQQARLFIQNGAGFDDWANNMAAIARENNKPVLVIADHIAPEHAEEPDPHFWLDPVLAMRQVERIRDQLMAMNQEQADIYRTNAQRYLSDLAMLHQTYEQGLRSCRQRDIVVSHDAFGYLAKRYGFTITPIAGISPEDEPSPREIAQLASFIRQKNIRHIFVETLADARTAETLAQETGVTLLVLNPIEGLTPEQKRAGETYISLMTNNLQNLRTAMLCQ